MSASRRLVENPLVVLGLGVGASRIEIEREAQKLLGMIELGFAEAMTYATPLGPRPRTAELVRGAVAALRDPVQRLAAELWLVPAEAATRTAEPAAPVEAPVTWPDARVELGWAPAAASSEPESESGS